MAQVPRYNSHNLGSEVVIYLHIPSLQPTILFPGEYRCIGIKYNSTYSDIDKGWVAGEMHSSSQLSSPWSSGQESSSWRT